MTDLEKRVLTKLIKMFTPYQNYISPGVSLKNKDAILGPDLGFGNMFHKRWLIEDFEFTDEEATWFIEQVHKQDV